MGFEARIIEFLQSGRNDFLSFLMLALTNIGDEVFFMVVAVTVYWCINKRFAFKFVNVYLLGAAAVEGVKAIFARPRPFDSYESIVSIGEKTHGYSFLSGHSSSIANISTQGHIALRKTKWRLPALITGAVLTLIVAFSRMYLGQHYLSDVLCGVVFGIGTAISFSCLFELLKDKEEMLFLGIVPICLILLVVLSVFPLPSNEDIFKVLGAYVAFTLGYYLEKKFVKYDVRSEKKWKHIVKVVLGLAVVLLLKEGLKFIFDKSILQLYSFLRYFIITFFAVFIAPLLFKISKL